MKMLDFFMKYKIHDSIYAGSVINSEQSIEFSFPHKINKQDL